VSILAALASALAVAGQQPLVPGDVAFWDRNNGLGLFYRCYSCPWRVARTTDGGRTWRVVRTAAVESPLVIARPGSAWIGRLKTDDRGRSWQLLPRSRYWALAFSSARTGWGIDVAGWRGLETQRLTRSFSGGRRWIRVANPCWRIREALVDLTSPSARSAWALCSGLYGAGNEAKTIFRTRDGGRHWRMVNRVDFRGSGPIVGSGLPMYGYGRGIEMLGDGTGWLWETRGWAFSTHDGGRTWTTARVTAAEDREAASVSFVTRLVGFMLLQDYTEQTFRYRLLSTRDGGASWSIVRRWRYQ
jgi:photosystem II stability/assembly factor-like uncharacterized protein